MPTSGQTYFIINKKSNNSALDLSGADQKSIIGFGFHGGDNQKWRVVQHGDGWTLQNVYNGKYLDLLETPRDGVSVIAVDTGNPRKWNIYPDEHDSNGWRITVPNTNQDVDLSNYGDPTPGTPIVTYGHWKGENQVWRFQQV